MHGAMPPFPQYVFMAWWCLVKHRDNFTFTLTLPGHPTVIHPESKFFLVLNILIFVFLDRRTEDKRESGLNDRKNTANSSCS